MTDRRLNVNKTTGSLFASLLAMTLVIGIIVPPSFAENASKFVTQSGDGYKIDYQALDAASNLTHAQRVQFAQALRKGEGYVAEDVAGLGGSCSIQKKCVWKACVPTGGDCTLSADPAATKTLAQIGAAAVTAAICAVIDSEDDELTAPFCELALGPIVAATIEPVLDQCANQGQSTSISADFSLGPPPSMNGGANCS